MRLRERAAAARGPVRGPLERDVPAVARAAHHRAPSISMGAGSRRPRAGRGGAPARRSQQHPWHIPSTVANPRAGCPAPPTNNGYKRPVPATSTCGRHLPARRPSQIGLSLLPPNQASEPRSRTLPRFVHGGIQRRAAAGPCSCQIAGAGRVGRRRTVSCAYAQLARGAKALDQEPAVA